MKKPFWVPVGLVLVVMAIYSLVIVTIRVITMRLGYEWTGVFIIGVFSVLVPVAVNRISKKYSM